MTDSFTEVWRLWSAMDDKLVGKLAALLESGFGTDDDADFTVKRYAGIALGRIGESALQPLMNSLMYGNHSSAYGAADGLSEMGAPAILPIVNAIKKECGDRNGEAWRALANIRDSGAIEPLIKVLIAQNLDVGLRNGAAYSLGIIGNKQAIEPLITILMDEKVPDVRWKAAEALGRIGNKQAIEPLITALKDDPVAEVRRYAAEALGNIGDKQAIEPLITALKDDPVAEVRWYAAESLGNIGDNSALPALESAQRNDNGSFLWFGQFAWYVKDSAAKSIKRIKQRQIG